MILGRTILRMPMPLTARSRTVVDAPIATPRHATHRIAWRADRPCAPVLVPIAMRSDLPGLSTLTTRVDPARDVVIAIDDRGTTIYADGSRLYAACEIGGAA